MARTYIISEICGDWALQIREPGHPHQFLYFNSENNADLVKSILEWEDAHPNEAVPYNPTLTPPNEWVEALEAINNAAVAYIEGGPYENDLPGMELAVEIDRLSRDFVRPPNEPLTIEQLREMDGEPVWVEEVEHWALIDVEKGGQWDGVPFAVWAENGTKFTYNIMNRNLHCYRRPPEGEENA